MNYYCNRCEKETWHDRGICVDCFKNHHEKDEQKRIQLYYQHEDKYKYRRYKEK